MWTWIVLPECMFICFYIKLLASSGLYNPGQLWLTPSDVIGRAKGFLPFVGMVTIQLTDYPALKYFLVGLMGLFVLTSKDPNQS